MADEKTIVTIRRPAGMKPLNIIGQGGIGPADWQAVVPNFTDLNYFDNPDNMTPCEYALITGNTAYLAQKVPSIARFNYYDIYFSVYGDDYRTEEGVYPLNGKTYYLKWTSQETFSIDGKTYQFKKVSTNYTEWYKYEEPKTAEPEPEQVSEEDIEVQRKANIALVRAGIANKMQEFSTMLSKIDKKLNENKSLYSTYVRFTIGDSVIVDTSSQAWDENCLVQLIHKQSGAGQANEFTLKILFAPNIKSYIAINQLESKLIRAMTITAEGSSTTLKSETELHLDCEFVYGYGDDESIRSEPYVGKVMGYSCELNNGLLQYTVTGVCGLYVDKEIRVEVKPEHYTDASGNEITNPLQFLQRFFEVEYGSNSTNPGLYDIKFLDDIEGLETTYSGGGFANIGQKNLFQMVSDILNGTMGNTEVNSAATNNAILPTTKTTFGYYVSALKDSENENKAGTFYVYKITPEAEEGEAIAADANIQFNWFSPSPSVGFNHLVKKWSPKYEGLIAIAMGASISKNGITYNSMDDSGNIVKRKSLGGARIGGDQNSGEQLTNMMQEYSTWALQCQLPMEADMTIQGCPYDVPLTGRIRVSAMMGHDGTLEHLSSGVYIVLGKTDTISSSGFESTLELYKFTSAYKPLLDTALSNSDYTNGGEIIELGVAELASGRYKKLNTTDWSTEEIIDINSKVGLATAAKNPGIASVEDYIEVNEYYDSHISLGILLDTETLQFVSGYISRENLSTENRSDNNVNIINSVIEEYNITL